MSAVAIIVAGGSGARLGADTNKVLLPLGGHTVLGHAIGAFARASAVSDVVVVIRPEDEPDVAAIVDDASISTVVVHGGATRHDSERAGLEAIAARIESDEVDVVLIHDAARPLVPPSLIDTVAAAATQYGGAIPVMPARPRAVHRDSDTVRPLDPARVRRAQTPQGFHARPLLDAYRAADTPGLDTAETVARHTDLRIRAVPGDPMNRKLTVPADYEWALRVVSRSTA